MLTHLHPEPRAPMTVGALIEILKLLPPDSPVIGLECRAARVIPQTSGAILIAG